MGSEDDCMTSNQGIPVAEQAVEYVRHSAVGNTIHCIPVVCPIGYQLSFCKENFTRDYCHKCPIGCIQNQEVDSRTVIFSTEILKCSPGPSFCPPDTIMLSVQGEPPVCECDITRGFVGSDAMFCMKTAACSPGMELKRHGRCSPCPPGTYKSTLGYGPCEPFTNCEEENRTTLSNGNATANVVCGKPLSTTTLTRLQITTANSSIPDFLLDDVLKEPSLHGDQNTGKNSQDTITRLSEENYNIPTFKIVFMALQTSLLLTILIFIFVVVMRIKKMNRDMTKGQKHDCTIDEECQLVSPDIDRESMYSLKKSIPNFISVCQPETLRTIYPEINERPCTPTAPEPSIPYNHNIC
ncbi:uncharacterized protein LOC117345150 isoform X2 [Pecten maximus]|uniref:uncharacterized protein LOC117345150 isoform X2 n=1 Tax=Pecten maximus TaxID=6579 RepID=UPI0014590EAD|nr:uncharacterized protein LOC117345150 isoform X2 [Pecten maximus]